MNFKRTIILALAIQATIAFAQEATQEETRLFQLSFVPHLGTNLTPAAQITHNLSINLIAGYNYGVKGLELGGIVNMDRQDVTGAQISGFGNIIGGDVKGAQIAGFTNIAKGNNTGLQLAGFTNILVKESLGAQVAGFYNQSKTTTGLQLGGFANLNLEAVKGAQIAGFMNSSKSIEGFQLAGFVNQTKTLKGIQLGFINIADTVESGATIGFINIVKTGMHKFQLDYNDVIDLNVSFRSGTDYFYSIISGGLSVKKDSYWSYGAGFGSMFNLKSNLYTGVELTTNVINPHGSHHDQLNLLNKFHWNVGYHWNKNLSFNGGPTLNVYVTNVYDEQTETYGDNIVKNPFYDETFSGTNVKMWIGYNLAIRF